MLNVVVGYDRQVRIPAYVVAESIMKHCTQPVNFTFLHRSTLQEFTRPQHDLDSTEFSISRFLTPYLHNYTGWTLFVDNDIVVQSDISELFSYADPKYAVLCVKHNYIPKRNTKFRDKTQTTYNYKNWSSVMLFNNDKCRALTIDYVNTASGLNLHQFKWLNDDKKIGNLPPEWNHLVGSSICSNPKLLHYTEGGPFYAATKNCQYSDEWHSVYRSMIKIDL